MMMMMMMISHIAHEAHIRASLVLRAFVSRDPFAIIRYTRLVIAKA